MKLGSLFAGIGGFDLAARWMGWQTAWFSEIESYACRVLKKHWPNVPNHGDITQIQGKDVEQVDILCGGFPCQDISLAGKGAGIEGPRSGLWSHYARLIEEIRPRYVVAENSSALRSRGLRRVLRDLHTLGYDAEWHCIPAAAVGAPHTRDRVWIVSHSHALNGNAGMGLLFDNQEALLTAYHRNRASVWLETTCPPPGVDHGVSAWVDRRQRTECLGNSLVPQVALTIFQAIQARESGLSHI